MPMGSRHRLTGRLARSARGLILRMDDGGVYALDADRKAEGLVGSRVLIEGTRSGFDRIDVDWIGPAEQTSPTTS
ncbi:DUF5818 domain-containing protein [Sphingomonas sp. S2-65]|uniref:DUF5818 domain-containing protein n=1 Tax=Sphingomonas sp. S2-65 TaxID=2903960 RepID=UPI001F330716|nr:DUF5818 domain-containing protein [Sphingomonas sp. S2-65]UYY58019.1 DUF5818 domain-containing protein [Sphingomonas sp. S2-65]